MSVSSINSRQRFITARPGVGGLSVDTWETLAARASQLSNANVTAADLINANVGPGSTPDQINAWIAAIGGQVSGDGVNFILPAGAQIALPSGVTVPSDSDADTSQSTAESILESFIGPPAPDPTDTAIAVNGGAAAVPINPLLLLGAAVVAGLLFTSGSGSRPRKR